MRPQAFVRSSPLLPISVSSLSTTPFRRSLPVCPTHPSNTHHISTMTADYTIYYAATPNGKKITLAAEEMALDYEISPIRFKTNDQFSPQFLKINPNNKIPALVDHTAQGGDLPVFESGAILEYMADKTGKFLPPPSDIRNRMAVLQWLYWQMAGFGPMLGQVGFFFKYSKEDVPVGKERYLNEAIRLYQVLDKQLAQNRYVAGDDYSIADMAIYWWSLVVYDIDDIKDNFQNFDNIKRWQKEVGKRPAVEKAKAIPFEW